MKKTCFLLLCLLANFMGVKAQVGYQISLLNTATGEPRANETVTVSISLSNNANEVFYSETKSATTNDFGVLSLSIGNADTFKDVDLTKMPFFIEVTANGVMVGKSQILSVPVAEVAKQLAPIKIEEIIGVWEKYDDYSNYYYSFNKDGSVVETIVTNNNSRSSSGTFFIEGNYVFIIHEDKGTYFCNSFLIKNRKLYGTSGISSIYTKQ